MLPVLLFALVYLEQSFHDLGSVSRGNLRHRKRKPRVVSVEPAAEKKHFRRDAPSVLGYGRSLESYAGRHVLGAGIRTARNLYPQVPQGFPVLSKPVVHHRGEPGGESLGRSYAETAGVGAGAGGYVLQGVCARGGKIRFPKRGVEGRKRFVGNPPDHEILLYRNPRRAVGEGVGHVGEPPRRFRGDVSQQHSHVDYAVPRLAGRGDVFVLPLRETGVSAHPLRRLGKVVFPVRGTLVLAGHAGEIVVPGRIRLERISLFLHKFPELFETELSDKKLHPRLHPHLSLPVPVENPDNGSRKRQKLLRGQKLRPQMSERGRGSESASHVDLKAAAPVAHPGPEAQVVNPYSRVVHVPVALEADLELPSHVLAYGISQHEVLKRLGVGSHVEGLRRRGAGHGRRGDVPHRVAAGFPGRDSRRRKLPHHVGNPFKLKVVELYVLASGEVKETVGVLVRNVGERPQLPRGESPVGNLYPLHLDPVLTLGVDSELKPYFLELHLTRFTRPVVGYLSLELVEFVSHELRQTV